MSWSLSLGGKKDLLSIPPSPVTVMAGAWGLGSMGGEGGKRHAVSPRRASVTRRVRSVARGIISRALPTRIACLGYGERRARLFPPGADRLWSRANLLLGTRGSRPRVPPG